MTGSHRDEFESDDELRALLRSVDPASGLAPADSVALTHQLQDVISSDQGLSPLWPAVGGPRASRDRRLLTYVACAAAVAVIAGAGGIGISALSGDGDPKPPTAATSTVRDTAPAGGPDSRPLAPIPGTTELGFTPFEGRCGVPSEVFIAQQQQAFLGTVTAIEDDSISLQASEVYAGAVAANVVVSAPGSAVRDLISATSFKVGGTYLVSASNGRVAVCGLSGKATSDLTSLYAKAFTS